MAILELDPLLGEISSDAPCGENLEYDADYGAMERAAQGTEERQIGDSVVAAEGADWREVETKATGLLGRTKDLRVAIYLATAALNLHGLAGFRDCLELIHRLVEQYWDAIHPQLDPDDDNDPTMRVNAIMTICDAQTTLATVRDAPMISSPVFGEISYRTVQSALGERGGDGDESAPSMSTIEAAFMDCDLDELRAASRHVAESIELVVAIEAVFTDQLGAAQAPNLEELVKLLTGINKLLTEQLTRRGAFDEPEEQADEETDAAGAASGTGPAKPISGTIQSRDDVIRTLEKICEYYDRYEPSSPVPLLLKRAKRLASKDFLDIIRDLVPEGISQAEAIRGLDGGSDDDGD